MPLPRCPCDRASLNLRRARRKRAASRCSLERDHPCTTAKADGREDPFHDSSSSSDFVLFPLHHTSDWSPARERVDASLGRVASASFWPSPITSASVATRHHTAGAPPTVHFHLRQPSNPNLQPTQPPSMSPAPSARLLRDRFRQDGRGIGTSRCQAGSLRRELSAPPGKKLTPVPPSGVDHEQHQPRQTIRTGLSSPYRGGRSSSA